MRRHGIGYTRKLAALLRAGVLVITPGALAVAEVNHHPACPFLRDPRRRCQCDPDITVASRDPAAA